MRKRFWAMFLAIAMVASMLPVAAFATDTDGNYTIGETYTSTDASATLPANIVDNSAWSSTPVVKEKQLICEQAGHVHDKNCQSGNLLCGHEEGHNPQCYSDWQEGRWVKCTKQEHQKQGFLGIGTYHQPDVGDGCWLGTSLKLLNVAYEVFDRDAPEWVGDALSKIEGIEGLASYYYYVPASGSSLICGHGDEHTADCRCKLHVHVGSCYGTTYTWTLKADRNGNGKPDDEETYTVTYDVNGADSGFRDQSFNNLSYNADTPKYTNNGANEVTPTKANHTFGGWDPTVAEKVTAPTSGNAIIYTAQWNPITKPVAPNGDTVKELLANYQVKVDCSKEAHTLATYGLADGCYEIAPVSGSAANGFTVDVTLKAAEYAKHYDKQNKYPVGAHTTTDKDVTITLTYDSSSTSWEFNGPTAVTTFNVNCTQYTVTFVKDNGEDNEATTVFAGQTVTAPAVMKDDYTLDGWYNGDTEFNFSTPIIADIMLTARWTADLSEVLTKEYDWVKVELNDNAAAAHAMLEGLVPFVTVTHDASGTIPTAGSAKEWWGANPYKVLGKNLTGVQLGKDTNSIDLEIAGVVTKTGDYTVTLKDGGTIEFVSDPGIFQNLPERVKNDIRSAVNLLPEKADLSSIVKAINGAIKLANMLPNVNIPLIIGENLPDVITKQDILNFLDKLFSDGVGSFTYMVITVEKADVPTPTTYTVSFDGNGGEREMAAQTFTKGQEQALTPNAFTKENCVFSGWNTKADGTGNAYTDKQLITVTADMTLYAQWKEDKNNDGIADEDQKFTVVYKDGEDVLQTSKPLEVGVKTPAYNGTPKKDGYLFKGWEPTVAATIDAADADAKCFITYTAKWEAIVLNTTVFDLIHVHMDDATTADLNALKGEGAKHVRLESAQYDKVEALLGYRVMAPIGVKSNANWWTENFAKKVTAAEITNVILAADKPVGSSDKIVIPMAGNEKYTVSLGYELLDVTLYGIDIDKICGELDKIQLPDLPQIDIDLEGINNVIQLIQALKKLGLTYDQIFQLMEIVINGVDSLEDLGAIANILKDIKLEWKDISALFDILKNLDKEDIQKLISILKKLNIEDLAAKLKDLKEIISKLENIDRNDIEKALEQLKNASTKENIESALKQLEDALKNLDGKDIQSQLNELLAKLEKMDEKALIAKIKELIKNQIPEDALKCMTPDELKELLKGLITKHQYSLSCLCINISKNKAPAAPTDDELKNLLLEKVTVDCDSTTAGHKDAAYGWIKDGVTLGKVVETETTWTCTATLAGWVYADAYNKDVAPDHPVTGVKPADATIDLTWNGDEWIPGNGVTFHVNCDKAITVKHTVTFDYDYDSWVVRVLVEDGKTVTAPASGVERTGYVIDGWYLDGKEYDFTTPVTSDITLVADWKVDRNDNGIADEKEYVTVTYTDGVANEVIFEDQTHDTLLEGDATPAFDGTPSRIGYTFKGWKPEVSETVTESVVYVAQWERNREPITPVGPTAPSVKVKYLNTKDHVAYIIGYENGTIRPRGEITRAEVATIFFRLMTDKARNQYWTTENDFNDVAEGQWFNLAVSTLNAAGVIVDAEYGNFRPNDPITRAELAVMAAQFCTVEGKLPKTSFTDVSKDHWAIDEIKLIEYAGWIEGYPDGTFRPDATITRAEAITIINRMLERAVEDSDMLEGMLTFIDCPTNEWFYEAVQEATNSHDYKRTKEEVEDYGYCYEIWTELEERPDWAAMEKTWLSQH